MVLSRPLAGACSSLVTSLLLYPLEVRKTMSHMNVIASDRVTRRGIVWNACGSFAATYLYFDTYERLLHRGTLVAPASAAVVSGLIASPVATAVRRAQLCTRVPLRRLSLGTHFRIYLLSLTRSVPKATVKYSVYEFVCRRSLALPDALRGCLGGLVASVVCVLLFSPIDYWRTHLSLHSTPEWRHMFNGVGASLSHSTLSNAFGHALLEGLSPRHRLRTEG